MFPERWHSRNVAEDAEKCKVLFWTRSNESVYRFIKEHFFEKLQEQQAIERDF